MRTRVESEAPAAPSLAPLALPSVAVAGIASDPEERYGGHNLPGDHPAWMRDTLSVSQRARALFAKLKPVVLVVIGAWEHRLRSIVIGSSRLSVDPSGSYRRD